MRRPSHQELSNKIREARRAISEGNLLILNQEAIAADALDLEYDIGRELVDVLHEFLDETSSSHYAGAHPPQRSYEEKIEGLELFAFVLEIRRFDCRIYYKFALAERVFWLVSLHRARPREDKR
jgi:hypothetical protein